MAPPNPNTGQRRSPWGSAKARETGFYSDQFTPEELALVAAFVQDPTVDDEIWMQRVVNRRLLAFVASPPAAGLAEGADADGQPVRLETLVRIAEALAAGTGRVARLLRDKRALSGGAADSILRAITQTLDELSTELGVDL